MIEIISSILEAEKKADEIVEAATKKAAEITLSGDSAADAIRENAVTSFKIKRKYGLIKAKEQSEKIYADKIEAGKKSAEDFYNSVYVREDEIAERLLRKILEI